MADRPALRSPIAEDIGGDGACVPVVDPGSVEARLARLEAIAERQAAALERQNELFQRILHGDLELMTTGELQEVLRVGKTKLAEMIGDGVIPSFKLPDGQRRFVKDAVRRKIRQWAEAK